MSTAGLAMTRFRGEPLISPGIFCNSVALNPCNSITIFLSVLGKMYPFRVFETDPIESIRLRIQDFTGFVRKKQKLVCGGRELSRSNSLLRDYDVTDGDVIHLVLNLKDIRAITFKTVCGKEFSFDVDRYRDVEHVKKEKVTRRKGFLDEEDKELHCQSEQLADQKLVHDICKRTDEAILHLLVRKSSAKVRPKLVGKNYELIIDASEVISERKCEIESDGTDLPLVENLKEDFLVPIVCDKKVDVPSAVLDVIEMTKDGLANGHDPVMADEGSGGAYLMMDPTGAKYVSVFKPTDEEPKAVNNPYGLRSTPGGEGLKRGTVVGQGAFREVAAYLLDHPISGRRSVSGDAIGFSGVPPTGMVKCLHNQFNHLDGKITAKIGSLQKFIKNNGSCEDMGPGAFPVEEVHKISVLDMRLANADRHAGNILFSKDSETGKIVLIPIDHGYCLPESFEDCTFDWLIWPQAKQPYSPETVDYIRSLDAEEDIALLKLYGWDMPVESARTLRISTMLLKKGVERGLTPFQIGSIMCRETERKKSLIEEIIKEAEDAVLPGTSETTFIETVSEIMDYHLDEVYQ